MRVPEERYEVTTLVTCTKDEAYKIVDILTEELSAMNVSVALSPAE